MGSSYKAPLDEIRFVLYDLLDAERTYASLGAAHATREVMDAVLEEAARFTETVLSPLNEVGDQIGCAHDKSTGAVVTPPGFRAAYAQFVEAGWTGLTAPEAMGGQALPESLGAAVKEMIDSANLGWGNYPLLSHGAIEALKHHGTAWQQEAYLKPIISGQWTGTMCLTEPQAGSDLGLLRTRAEPVAGAGDDGGGPYAITGTKIFIPGGEHALTDNIVHLVLARLPDAPAGTKGISMFIVPKLKVAKDGTVGERNAVRCASIEHKMGIHGSSTCVMNFDGAEGWLIGEKHRGLNAMFTMMNTARLAVGLQGLGVAERALQNAERYSLDRLQGRALGGARFPDKPADPIAVHAPVRNMLLGSRALVEGGRMLALHAALQVDIMERSSDPAAREDAEALLGFLTPIVKACLTEWAVQVTNDCMQVFGGMGYIRETGMEQLARDARITTIYEGTTQIQALDLLGRKILQQQGKGMRLFLGMIQRFCEAQAADPAMHEFVLPLAETTKQWGQMTMEIAQKAGDDPGKTGEIAMDYLYYSGYAVLAYWWAREAAAPTVRASSGSDRFAAARYYFARILPRIATHAALIRAA
jgi:alkylation response protein AidB-like acyl-CoA dehydrogenase